MTDIAFSGTGLIRATRVRRPWPAGQSPTVRNRAPGKARGTDGAAVAAALHGRRVVACDVTSGVLPRLKLLNLDRKDRT